MDSVGHRVDEHLIPPQEMLFDGSSSAAEFLAFGEGFCREFLTKRAALSSGSSVLDVGCGNGSLARALTQVLAPTGRYEGLDVHRRSIEWLREHYSGCSNFEFTHADVYNKMYNPQGTQQARDYRLPFPDNTFDIVVLKSVFTHMLPADLRRYLFEVARVLAPAGRAVVSYFLLNSEARALESIAPGAVKISLSFALPGDSLCRVQSLELPENAVGHDEARIREWYREAGLSVVEIGYGDWCGRLGWLGLQDSVIALKA